MANQLKECEGHAWLEHMHLTVAPVVLDHVDVQVDLLTIHVSYAITLYYFRTVAVLDTNFSYYCYCMECGMIAITYILLLPQPWFMYRAIV